MCMSPSRPAPPPPPAPVELPAAPTVPAVSARPQMQAGPAKATQAGPETANMDSATIKRRGKRGMVIQLGGTAGTNIPGA